MTGKTKRNLLVILAAAGAAGIGRYGEAAATVLLYGIGVVSSEAAMKRSRRMIEETIDIRPVYATRKVRGREFRVEPQALKLYNRIVIKPGERVPVDAEILSGESALDVSALTGEPEPVAVKPGDKIFGGSINLDGVLEAKVTALYRDSTVSRIMEMVDEAGRKQSRSEGFVQRFETWYAPAIVAAALLMMLLPQLLSGFRNPRTWIYRGLVMLIAGCPAGLVFSTPAAFLGGIVSAARQGILVKGGNFLEILANVDTFIFDKTGTLTEGVFRVRDVKPVGMTREELLEIAAHVEHYSNHPIARPLKEAWKGAFDSSRVRKVKEEAGIGVSALFDGEWVHIGNQKMADRLDVETDELESFGTVLYVIYRGSYAGYIVIEDAVRQEAEDTLDYLKEMYQAVLVMLTGGSREAAAHTARLLHMDYAYAELMPEDKLELVEEFLDGVDDTEKVACVGDGINDAPVLARADVGIAMGALGSAAAIEAADVVLMDDELTGVVRAVKIAKETMRVVKQNITFAVTIKLIVLALAALGYITMWNAVFADMCVMLISIMNAAWVAKYSA